MPFKDAKKAKTYSREYARKRCISDPAFRETRNEAVRRWRERNPKPSHRVLKSSEEKAVTHRKAQQRYRVRNPKKIREMANSRYRKIECKIRICLGVRMYRALKGIKKCANTVDLVGCSLSELKRHLEASFIAGMSWKNYGPVWHVDHKRPCASFDLSDPEQQKQCFHYTNLQPLLAFDNFRKGGRWLPVTGK